MNWIKRNQSVKKKPKLIEKKSVFKEEETKTLKKHPAEKLKKMNWIKREQKHSQGSKDKCAVQISDLPRSGSMPLSFFSHFISSERAENSRIPLTLYSYSTIIQTLIFRYSIHQVIM